VFLVSSDGQQTLYTMNAQ